MAALLNRIEAILWLAVSIALLLRALARKFRRIPISLELALLIPTFAIFGFSDWIEAQTGAWWKPWWLLLVKSLCVAVFMFCLVSAFKKPCNPPRC